MGVRSRLMSAGKLGKGLLGATFIVIGVAIVSGADKRIEAALVDASPPWLTRADDVILAGAIPPSTASTVTSGHSAFQRAVFFT